MLKVSICSRCRVIHPKCHKNSNESCTFVTLWQIGQENYQFWLESVRSGYIPRLLKQLQSIVAAGVCSQCLYYLGYITLSSDQSGSKSSSHKYNAVKYSIMQVVAHKIVMQGSFVDFVELH